MNLFQWILRLTYIPAQKRLAKQIGCRLVFQYFPKAYLPGMVRCAMTRTWKSAGLNIIRGQNHFTVGNVDDGRSGRFDPNSVTYQSWLGGYSVKLVEGELWSVKDYCKLAIADQNSWLGWYGDPVPFTSVEGWQYEKISPIRSRDGREGMLYQGGFSSHCDMGADTDTLKFRFVTRALAGLYNLSSLGLSVRPNEFAPNNPEHTYHPIDGKVYIALFDISPEVKVMLYANGISNHDGSRDTFDSLQREFIKTMESCEILDT